MKRLSSMSVEAKASIAYTVCSVIQRGIAIAMIPLFTRLMTTEQYGQTSIYLSWFALFSIFLSLNLPYGSFQTAMVKFEDRRKEYVSSIDGIFIVLSLLFLCIYLPFRAAWDELFSMPTLIVVVMVLEVAATSFIQSWMGLNRFLFKYKSVFVVTVLLAILSQLSALAFVLLSDDKGNAKIIGSAAVTFCFGLVILIYCVKQGKHLFKKDLWKYALGFNIPLLIYYLSQVVFNQSDILMINYFCGTDKSGIYNIAYSVGMLLTFLVTAINGAYTPWFYLKLKDGKQEEDRPIAAGLVLAMAVLLVLVVAAAPEIVLIMAGEPYMEAIWIVPPVAASALLLFYCCLFDRILFFYEKKSFLSIATVVAAIVNIVLNFLLIPVVGYIVAGYTTFISYFVLVLFDFTFARKTLSDYGIGMNMYNLKWLAGVLLVFCGASVLLMLLYPFLVVRYLIVVIVLAVCAIKRKKLIELFSEIRQP